MARQRKAWADLAPSTRARYERAAKRLGFAQDLKQVRTAYKLGIIPSTAVYGKKPSRKYRTGEELTDRQAASLRRQARSAGLKSVDVDDILNRAMDSGASYTQVERLLKEQAAIRRLPKALRKQMGRAHWEQRDINMPIELYWY